MATSHESNDELRKLLATTAALRLEKQQISGIIVVYCVRYICRETWAVRSTSSTLQVFQSVHDMSHPGTKATAKLVAQRFVWPGIQKDCSTSARACQACQRSKVSRHTATSAGDFTLPAARFPHVHIDLISPFPTSTGYTYCLIALGCFTHWPEAIPIPDSTSDTVARALLTCWISSFGCSQTITTDQGRQFESHFFHSLTILCGIQLSWTTSYHPAANRLVERFYRTLKGDIIYHRPAVDRGASSGSSRNPHSI
jgi:transposase InsO family protein